MNNGSGNNHAGPGDEPDDWRPTVDQPWRPVHPDQIVSLYDYGQFWCQDRHAHPQYQPGGYPALSHPVAECQSYGGSWDGWFQDDRAGLDGPPGYLLAYLSRPFRYGQRRGTYEDTTRLVLEFVPVQDDAAEPFRCSIPATLIRSLAAHLIHTADVGDGWREPRTIRHSLTD